MRYFLRTVYERKRGKNAMEEAIFDVRTILDSRKLKERQQLFHLYAMAESEKEGYAPWNKMLKKYPHFEKYIAKTRRYRARETSNFPIFEDGKLTFCDDSFNHIEIEEIVCKYATYHGVLVWDKINFFGDCDDTPYCDGSVILRDKENYRQSESCGVDVGFIDGPFPQYASNSVRFFSKWDLSAHQIVVVTEVRTKEELEKAYTMLKDFEEKFGKPRKQYMWSGFSYDDLEEYTKKNRQANEVLYHWIEEFKEESSNLKLEIKNKKLPSVNTQKNNFLKKYGFERFPIKPWDDYGYFSKTQYNFYKYITLYKDYQSFEFELIGADFLRRLRVPVAIPESISDEKEKMDAYCQYISLFLERFQNEVLPKYVEIFGESSDLFTLNSAQAFMGASLRFSDKYATHSIYSDLE